MALSVVSWLSRQAVLLLLVLLLGWSGPIGSRLMQPLTLSKRNEMGLPPLVSTSGRRRWRVPFMSAKNSEVKAKRLQGC